MSQLPPLPHDPAEVKARLRQRIRDLLPALGIRERERGGLVEPRNPTRKDRHPGSFVIWLKPGGEGAWRDYATGESGDVWDLIIYLKGLREWIDAYWWALEFLALGKGEVRSKEQAQADRERFERERKAAEARQGALEAAKSRALKGLWLGLPGFMGTPAETYLRGRGIDLDRLAKTPEAIRWCRSAEWIDTETGEVFAWENAMVTAMTLGPDIVALHRTFLKPDGSGKADRAKAKTMIGPVRGSAIRLSRGPSGLSPSAAARKGVTDPLVICEGIEDGLVLACARPDYRVWAAGSLSLMGLVEWPACASAVILAADNDWDKPEAVAAFERVEAWWRGQARGRPVKVVRASRGKDFNDMVAA